MTNSRPNRIVLCGEARVGKTCLFRRLKGDEIDTNYSPTALSDRCQITLPDFDNEVLNIWDTAGDIRFRDQVSLYLRQADVIVIVTDSLNSKTLHRMQRWARLAMQANRDEMRPNMVFVRTKKDAGISKHEEVSSKDAAKHYHYDFFVVSSVTCEGIDDLTAHLVELCRDRKVNPPPIGINLDEEDHSDKCRC